MSRKKLRLSTTREPAPAAAPEVCGTPPRVTPREGVVAAIIVLAGVAIRLAILSHAAVEHFDEGVYASNLWSAEGQYPMRHLYAPPLFPALVEWSCIIFGPTHWGTLAVSLAAGCATVASVWWIARAWFGGAAGVAAATLASFSEIHAAFSRSALTDVLLLFWLLWAVYFVERAFRFEDAWHVALAGVATGLAWCTKYNGWLPLAIGLTALPVWLAMDRPARPRAFRLAIVCLVVAIIAACLWWPVFSSLQGTGGYSAVAANHRRYVVGLAGWPASFAQQWANLRHFDGGLACGGVAMAVILAGARRRLLATLSIAALMLAGAMWLGTGAVLAIASAAGIGAAVVNNRHRSASGGTNWLPVCIVAVWFGALLVVTPLYHPYARLTLPWLAASWFGAALAISLLVPWQQAARGAPLVRALTRPRWRVPTTIVLCAAVVATCLAAPRVKARGIPAWEPRTGLETIAREIATRIDQVHNRERVIVAVYGEPALFFHLRAAGLPNVEAVAGLSFDVRRQPSRDEVVFLVTGPHADGDPAFAEQWRQAAELFEDVASFSYQASEFVLLDRFHPRSLEPPNQRPIEFVRLRQLRKL